MRPDRVDEPRNGWRYRLVGGRRPCLFAGTSFKPRKLPENAATPTTPAPAFFAGDRVYYPDALWDAVLGGVILIAVYMLQGILT